MFCGHCGQHNPGNNQFCPTCGKSLAVEISSTPQPAALPPPSPYLGTPVLPPQTSGKAIASLILGCFAFFLPAAIAAIVLGHISRSNIRESAGRLKGAGMSTAGLVFGYMGVAILPVLIIAAIAIPNLLRSRIAANEASAVGSIRTLNTAEVTYAATYPANGFACNLSQLGSDGAPNADHAGLLDGVLASGTKSGYRFALSNCSGRGLATTYSIVADPLTPNQTGVRAFCSDQSGVIRYESRGSAETCGESSPPLM